MNKIIFGLLLLSATIQAQDIVKLTDGTEMNVRTAKQTPESIAFERGKSGLFYVIKEEIDEIRFENGTVEKIRTTKNHSMKSKPMSSGLSMKMRSPKNREGHSHHGLKAIFCA